MRRSSRPPPHGREHAWLETSGNPDARGTDLPKSRASGSRTPATGLPRPPIRQRYELSYAAHPEATQVAGGAVACVRAVGPFERRTARSRGVATHTHLQRGPRGGSRTQPEGAACTRVVRLTAPVRARAERAWGHGERVVAVPQHATRRCGGCAGMVWRWAREPAKTVPASHVDDEACVSFCMLWAGRENQRTRVQIGTLVATITTLRQFHLPRAVLGVFSCHAHHAHHAHPLN